MTVSLQVNCFTIKELQKIFISVTNERERERKENKKESERQRER